METRLLLALLIASFPAASMAQEEMDEYEIDDTPVLYQCDPAELLILYNRSDTEVRMHCSPPQVCGQERVSMGGGWFPE